MLFGEKYQLMPVVGPFRHVKQWLTARYVVF